MCTKERMLSQSDGFFFNHFIASLLIAYSKLINSNFFRALLYIYLAVEPLAVKYANLTVWLNEKPSHQSPVVFIKSLKFLLCFPDFPGKY